MADSTDDFQRQKQQYWREMTYLKADASYIRLYRDAQSRWVTALGALKAIASSTGIAAWAIWREYAFLWGSIIAASQLADALKNVFPFAKKHKAASEHTMTLHRLFIDVQLEWENIVSSRFTDSDIMRRIHQLRKLRLEALHRDFTDGLAQDASLRNRAKAEAETYFKSMYGV